MIAAVALLNTVNAGSHALQSPRVHPAVQMWLLMRRFAKLMRRPPQNELIDCVNCVLC